MADNYNKYTKQQRPGQQPHFLRRDHHGMGDGAGREGDDAAINNGIENLVLPRTLPEGMKRNYIRKRRNDGIIRTQLGQDNGGVGQHQEYNMPQPDAFGPPHLLDDSSKYYAQEKQRQQHRIDLADADRNYDHSHALTDNDDSPWQISLVFLFGIVAVLVFLILNLLIDPAIRLPNQRSGGRSRHKRRVSSFTTKKKKTDAWSEDEVDQGNLADNETGGGVRAGGAHHAYNAVDGGDDSASSGIVMQEGIAGRSACLDNQDSASSSLYYAPPGYFPQGPQQQHRQRKPQAATGATQAAASTTASETATVVAPVSPAPNRVLPDSRRQYKRSPSSRSQQKSPMMSPPKAVVSPSVLKRDLKNNPPPAQAGGGGVHDAAYLGAGLEGFQSPQRKQKPQAPPPPPIGEKGGVVLATPKRVSERQVSIDLESGHPSEAEDEDEIGGETGATTGDGADYGIAAGPKRLGRSSPFQSFGSIPSPDYTEKKKVSATTPTVGSSNAPPPPPLLDMSKTRGPTVDRSESFESPQGLRHRRISSLTTPKLAVGLGHEDMEAATPLVDNKRRIRLDKESSTSFDSQDSSRPSSQRMLAVPFMPNINEYPSEVSPLVGPPPVASGGGDALVPTPSVSQGATPVIPEFAQCPENSDGSASRASHISAPRSVPIEDLHLIRMESGHGDSFGGKWAADGFDFAKAPAAAEGPVLPQPKVYQHSYRRQETPLHANYGPGQTHGQIAAKTILQQSLHQVDEVEASGEEEVEGGGNQIKHKRDDLTTWSDSAASLTSPIDFKEIKLLSVIGGGGFGQVWKASWRGTPIAVKLLSMSAQTDNVPKKVLQEFVSEINMLSGMRHPNICLYMGACLVPPNRAIVTELAAHGSVWDALRQPLDSPYVAADGLTRKAWPLSLYGITDTPAPVQVVPGQQWYDASAPKQDVAPHIPFPPSGTWPWALVKRVASGGVRGMIYLHGGSPPVLHRDLKSANLLLDDSYTAKIADFGLSRIKATERSMTGNCGTVQWMPPECLASSDYAEPADVYSFGIIMWELLTRECPFDGKTPIQCALAVLNNDARPPIPDWCPPALASLIKSCVTRIPSERPTFEEILEALDGMK